MRLILHSNIPSYGILEDFCWIDLKKNKKVIFYIKNIC